MYYFQIVGLIVGNQCVIRLVDFNGYFAALSFPQHSIVKFTMVHCIINNVLLGSPFPRPFPLIPLLSPYPVGLQVFIRFRWFASLVC